MGSDFGNGLCGSLNRRMLWMSPVKPSSTPVLWQSPDPASFPAPIFPAWATAQLAGIQVEGQPAIRSVHTALGLPERWPTGDAFPPE